MRNLLETLMEEYKRTKDEKIAIKDASDEDLIKIESNVKELLGNMSYLKIKDDNKVIYLEAMLKEIEEELEKRKA